MFSADVTATKKLPTVVAVVGPTGSGKTSLAIRLAKQLSGEVIACDSRTVYRYMDIGTAKPTLLEQEDIPHHLIDIVDPDTNYSVADFKSDAAGVLEKILQRGSVPIVCGGTGFYARALLEGLVIPEVSPQEELRAELNHYADVNGNDALLGRLAEVDLASAQRLNSNDRFRVIRALEVSLVLGKPFSEAVSKSDLPFRVVWIGLNVENREYLKTQLELRFTNQLQLGLVAEVEGLYRKFGPCRTLVNSVNYAEFIPYFEGKVDRESAEQECLKHNYQLARKQTIWFRSNKAINWFSIDQLNRDLIFSKAVQLISSNTPQ